MTNHDEPRTPRTPYESMRSDPEGSHPVDDAVFARLPHGELRQQIHEHTARLTQRGEHVNKQWLALEQLINQYHQERAEAYFNLGYDCGAAAGRGDAFRALSGIDNQETRALVERIHQLAMQAALPTSDTVACLVETAWAFVLGLEGKLLGSAKDAREGSE